jgi:simple sugar transport system permease protein
LVLPFVVGGIIIAFLGHDPIEAYIELFKGAFIGKLNLGTTLEKWCPILLTGLAFCVTSRVSFFNLGVEGSLYIGALFSAAVGFGVTGLPWFIHIPLALLAGVAGGAVWGLIPGLLKVYYKVSEVCTTILLNYVAMLFTSYMIINIWPSGSTGAATPMVERSATLLRILRPSRANVGLIIALIVYVLMYLLIQKTNWGYKLRSIGTNIHFAQYIGVDTGSMILLATAIAGAIGGLAGSVESLGIYRSMITNFSNGIAYDGMLAALISKNKLTVLPFYSFFIAALKAGADGMERNTGVPQALIASLIAVIILLLAMEELFNVSKYFKRKNTTDVSPKADAPTA